MQQRTCTGLGDDPYIDVELVTDMSHYCTKRTQLSQQNHTKFVDDQEFIYYELSMIDICYIL